MTSIDGHRRSGVVVEVDKTHRCRAQKPSLSPTMMILRNPIHEIGSSREVDSQDLTV